MEHCDKAGPKRVSSAGAITYKTLIVVVVIALGLSIAGSWIVGLGRRVGRQVDQQAPYPGRTPTFSGNSQKLTQTVIVPTLDSPSPPGKNVIWCSSFQLAWNELRDNVLKAPLQVIGAEEVADRLNVAKQSTSDLEPESFYATGGWIRDGIVDKIRKDMAAKFPSHVLPDFSGYDSGLLAYCYLTANVPFKVPFGQIEKGLAFTDSQGGKSRVEAFGLPGLFGYWHVEVREQVEVLYVGSDPNLKDPWEISEYAIDLCKYSQPYQVVAALVEPRGSLAETFEYVRSQVDKAKHSEDLHELGRRDILEVPEMVWRIDHRFLQLIGKPLANVKGPITEAMQTIEFRLDRSGAKVESEALMAAKARPNRFAFDRPFLVYMQKRGAEQPFLVMWVDNAELLVRK
ncbi:MAG: hypothetical protein JW955_09455 [Sedimentisphaerales bacterium]|nr:hypothetical protein [Sedimentisphaerales bacterium]